MYSIKLQRLSVPVCASRASRKHAVPSNALDLLVSAEGISLDNCRETNRTFFISNKSQPADFLLALDKDKILNP